MRGGALPLLFWALLLALAGGLNAVWTGDAIQIGTFSAAVFMIVAVAFGVILRSPRREALRRGEAPRGKPLAEAVPHTSFGAAFAAVGVGVGLFGLAFGHFLIYLGVGMIILGVGRWALEERAQRRALRAHRGQR